MKQQNKTLQPLKTRGQSRAEQSRIVQGGSQDPGWGGHPGPLQSQGICPVSAPLPAPSSGAAAAVLHRQRKHSEGRGDRGRCHFSKVQEKLRFDIPVVPDASQFGFPWTEAAPVEEQKHRCSSNSRRAVRGQSFSASSTEGSGCQMPDLHQFQLMLPKPLTKAPSANAFAKHQCSRLLNGSLRPTF